MTSACAAAGSAPTPAAAAAAAAASAAPAAADPLVLRFLRKLGEAGISLDMSVTHPHGPTIVASVSQRMFIADPDSQVFEKAWACKLSDDVRAAAKARNQTLALKRQWTSSRCKPPIAS